MRLSARQKFYLTLTLVVLVLAAATYFLPYSLLIRISEASHDLQTAEAELSSVDQRLELIKNEEVAILSRGDQIRAIEDHFFSPKEQLRVVEAIESIGRLAGVKLESNVVTSDKNTLTFRLIAEGQYSTVAKFVKLIENAPLYFDIQSYALERLNPLKEDSVARLPDDRVAASVRGVLVVKLHSLE